MVCLNSDGTITESVKKLLDSLKTPKTPEEVAGSLEEPLHKIRKRLLEMQDFGFVASYKEEYVLTEKGKTAI